MRKEKGVGFRLAGVMTAAAGADILSFVLKKSQRFLT
jgi:hypothetical protein